MKTITIILILFTIGTGYVLTLREGHSWGGDFSMYILHAKNIADGVEYGETGYIYNPSNPSLGPKIYPPLFPLLLSPVYAWFGLNLTAMKVEIILLFLANLTMIVLVFKDELPFSSLVALVVLLGANPYFWDIKDHILSDIPFLFFVFCCFWGYSQAEMTTHQTVYAVLTGIFLYLSYATRSIGLILLPSFLLSELLRFRKIRRVAVIATTVSVILIGFHTMFFRETNSYFDQFALNLNDLPRKSIQYVQALLIILDNGHARIFRYLLYLLSSGLAILGFFSRIKKKNPFFEVFTLMYLGVILFWPANQGTRFMIPLIPLFLFYVFYGISHTKVFRKYRVEKPLFTILVVAVLIAYIGKYATLEYGSISEGIAKKETVELFEFVKQHTKEDDVLIFWKPRVLALFTGRRVSVYPQSPDDADFWEYLRHIQATYLLVSFEDPPFLFHLVENYHDRFDSVYSNPDFTVYKIR